MYGLKSARGERIRTICRLRPHESFDSDAPVIYPASGRYFHHLLDSNAHVKYELFPRKPGSLSDAILRLHQPTIDPIFSEPSPYNPPLEFVFDGVIGEDVDQGGVYDSFVNPILDSFMGGINTCVCCYGQTGAGKTWTMSGSDTFQSRGLIQRSIESLFERLKSDSDNMMEVMVSYMEIYNEVPYDLLGDCDRVDMSIESFPRVVLQEDESGTVHLRNLSLHTVTTCEEAIDLFLFGNMNRAVSSTVMNQASSRSHCIFTIHLESRALAGSPIVKTSKFHLVDLAGSERVWKTGLSDQNLREARHINKSLHFLEQVMNSLHKKSAHVPYRNSVLTSVLRDSLGGNCKTVLVVNLSTEARNFSESVASCRFAQRCRAIQLKVTPNEKINWKEYADFLKNENEKLRKDDTPTHVQQIKSPDPALPSPPPTMLLRPIEESTYAFISSLPESQGWSLRDLQDACGSNLSLFPRETRKKLIEAIRNVGMDFRVNCVGDLCAVVQVLIAKLMQSDDERRVLKDKLKTVIDKQQTVPMLSIRIDDPGSSQWQRSGGADGLGSARGISEIHTNSNEPLGGQ